MASREEIELYNEIISKGCCKRCALRYLGQCKTLLTFDYPNTCLVNFGYISPMDEIEDVRKAKIQKHNPCSVCLGLLQDPAIEEILSCENLDIIDYQSKTFVAYITFPTCILIRDHSMKIYLKERFPKLFESGTNVIKMNNAWRYSVEKKLCQILGKTYSHQSKLSLHFYTQYLLEDEEMAVVQRFVKTSLSKHCISHILETIPDSTFTSLIKVPPSVPLYSVTFKELKFYSEAIHLVGNYCKYSRDLFQVSSKFGEVGSDCSVESIILNAVRDVARDYKDAVFKASGFDDQNSRVLGDGRLIHLQLNDPKFETMSRKHCQVIEDITRKPNVMEVKNLREADKRDIAVLIDTEQHSVRSYKILCMVYQCKNIDHCINAVNMMCESFFIQQKLPVRLLYQRSISIKKKKVYSIRAKRVKEHLLELDLCVQCGLHIPEFINGDFGRTKPSLCDIIKAKADVLAIDLMGFQSSLPEDIEGD